MKAWLVREKDEYCATVVFAETRGKARAMAMHTETCEYADFLDIEVSRKPQIDKYYTEGKKEMDWFNSKDRIALVKDGGFDVVMMNLILKIASFVLQKNIAIYTKIKGVLQNDR